MKIHGQQEVAHTSVDVSRWTVMNALYDSFASDCGGNEFRTFDGELWVGESELHGHDSFKFVRKLTDEEVEIVRALKVLRSHFRLDYVT